MRPVAIGALAGLAAAAALAPLAVDTLRDLRAARAERAALGEAAAAPPLDRTIVAAGAIAAPSPGAAADALAARLRARAIRDGLLVEDMAPVAAPGLARVRLSVSGSEDAVIAFADAVERDRAVARFAHWSIAARGAGVALTGEAVAPWR